MHQTRAAGRPPPLSPPAPRRPLRSASHDCVLQQRRSVRAPSKTPAALAPSKAGRRQLLAQPGERRAARSAHPAASSRQKRGAAPALAAAANSCDEIRAGGPQRGSSSGSRRRRPGRQGGLATPITPPRRRAAFCWQCSRVAARSTGPPKTSVAFDEGHRARAVSVVSSRRPLAWPAREVARQAAGPGNAGDRQPCWRKNLARCSAAAATPARPGFARFRSKPPLNRHTSLCLVANLVSRLVGDDPGLVEHAPASCLLDPQVERSRAIRGVMHRAGRWAGGLQPIVNQPDLSAV